MNAVLRLSVTAAVAFLVVAGTALAFYLKPPSTEYVPATSVVAPEGEEYLYEVSWTWFKLGTIRLKTLGGGRAEAYIDSYVNVPFVDLHSIHTSLMDSLFYSRGSRSIDKKDNEWTGLDYRYDLPAKRLYVEEIAKKDPKSEPYKRTMRDTVALSTTNFVDGLSIAYFPRRFIHTTTPQTVPTVLYGKLGETVYKFSNEHATESIDAVDNPVKVVELEGTTTVVGVYGMTGDFKGWFSDDDAAVPIKGKLKVLIGNATVELIKWNRKGWNPPQ
jgi:hypothetical protein